MEKAIKSISRFVPTCEQEKVDKDLFLEIATNIPNSLTRESKLAHFVSSAFVINKDKNKVISAYHNIFDSWSWLGGHTDGDDDFYRVVKKEIEEESGIKNLIPYKEGIFSLESLPVWAHMRKGVFVPAHTHLNVTHVFIADDKEKLRIQKDENSNIAWLGFDELIEKSKEPYMIPVYKKIINQIEKEK